MKHWPLRLTMVPVRDESLLEEKVGAGFCGGPMTGFGTGIWTLTTSITRPVGKACSGMRNTNCKESSPHGRHWFIPTTKTGFIKKVQDYIESRTDSFEVEMRMRHKDGHDVAVLSRAFLVHHDIEHKPTRLVGTHVDITERRKSEQFVLDTSNILRMIATREPASDIYDSIASDSMNRATPGCAVRCLSWRATNSGTAGRQAFPKNTATQWMDWNSVPASVHAEHLLIPGNGSWLKTSKQIPKWAKIKHVALPHGMRCCWSEPIKNSMGEVLGAFGMYYDYPNLPNDAESNDLESAARLAGIIMEREKSEKELRLHRQHLEELVAKRTAEA